MNNTVIDWFLPWPPQALLAVAQSFLGVWLHIYIPFKCIFYGKVCHDCDETYSWNIWRINHFVFSPGEIPLIPEEHSAAVIAHVCMVHGSVGDYSKLFLQKLRRCNYVTPKNYLDFINTYSNLLEEKDQYILGERMEHVLRKGLTAVHYYVWVDMGNFGLIMCFLLFQLSANV